MFLLSIQKVSKKNFFFWGGGGGGVGEGAGVSGVREFFFTKNPNGK